MILDRRALLRAQLAAAGSLAIPLAGRAQDYGQALRVDGDSGRPVANMRLPGELTAPIESLRGLTLIGARAADVTLYEYFDYNCPYCRTAALDLAALVQADPSLRIGLVNHPILSAQSAQAAKVVLAVQKALGSAAAFQVYSRLLSSPGRIDGPKALDVATATGLSRSELEKTGDSEPIRQALRAQIQSAQSLGLNATPSYVIGNYGILGHPGRGALAGMIAATRRCDRIACR